MAARKGGGGGGARRKRRPSPLQALQALDERLSNALFRGGLGVPRLVWKAFEASGDGLLWLAAAVYFGLRPGTTPAARHAWVAFLLCWVIDLALVGSLKLLVRRSRPVYNLQSDFTVVVAVDHFSFPSGHSSRASFVALFAAVVLASTRLQLCAAAAVWAVATALSRAAMGRHYLSDVLVGLLLGVATVAIATKGRFDAAHLAVTQQQSEAIHSWLRDLLKPTGTLPFI